MHMRSAHCAHKNLLCIIDGHEACEAIFPAFSAEGTTDIPGITRKPPAVAVKEKQRKR